MLTDNEAVIVRGKWVNIEGTDAVGKTRLVRELGEQLSASKTDQKVVTMPEFSHSPIGLAIQGIINKNTFFGLSDAGQTPIGETLVLVGDYVYQMEKLYFGTTDWIITDRGPLSFVVYQGLRLEDNYGQRLYWRNWLRQVMKPMGDPDITICLVSNIEIIEARLRSRGDTVTKEGLNFIDRAQKRFVEEANLQRGNKSTVIENNGSFSEVVSRVLDLIEQM